MPAGFPITRADVIRIVHIGDSTLEKRVSEFAGTDASALTAIEFEEHSKELERDEQLRLDTISTAAALAGPLPLPEHGCEHLGEYLINIPFSILFTSLSHNCIDLIKRTASRLDGTAVQGSIKGDEIVHASAPVCAGFLPLPEH